MTQNKCYLICSPNTAFNLSYAKIKLFNTVFSYSSWVKAIICICALFLEVYITMKCLRQLTFKITYVLLFTLFLWRETSQQGWNNNMETNHLIQLDTLYWSLITSMCKRKGKPTAIPNFWHSQYALYPAKENFTFHFYFYSTVILDIWT